MSPRFAVRLTAPLVALGLVVGACEAGPVPATPPVVAGTEQQPREVNLIARDYAFLPATLDLVPGERVILHLVNGGLVTHEAILGDARVQDAWEAAEAAVAGAPPGPTPVVSVPPDVAGIRLVVPSGGRVDLDWTVPADAATEDWIVGCHIAGHLEKGMQVPVRWVQPNRNVTSPGSGVETTAP